MIKRIFKTRAEMLISCFGFCCLWAIFIIWAVGADKVNKAGYCAGFLSCAMFTAVCLGFVRQWTQSWSSAEAAEAIAEHEIGLGLKIFAAFLAADAAYLLLIYAVRRYLGTEKDFLHELDYFLNIDSGNYLDIAQYWYYPTEGTNPARIVFYPAYPLLTALPGRLLGNYMYAAVAVSALFFAFSAVLLYKLLRLDYQREAALRAVKYLAILPPAFFFAAPMSESVFIFFCIAAIYMARRKRWLAAGLLGAVSAFTRSLGVLVFAPLFFEAFEEFFHEGRDGKRLARELICLLLVPVGTLAYLLINYDVFGDPFAFMKYEDEVWGQSLGLFFSSTAMQTDNALADIQTELWRISLGQWLPNVGCCFGALLLMSLSARKLRASYSVFFIVYYFMAIGLTYLISAPRYLVAAVPIYPALAEICKNKKTDRVLTLLCIPFAIYYTVVFALGWNVY